MLEADLVYSGAAVTDEEYDRPANPCLCLLAEAKTGMMLKADMTGPEEDAGMALAEAVVGNSEIARAPKEIRVRNVVIEAVLAHLCREAGIRLRRVKRLQAVDDFLQEMKKFGY